MYNKSNWSSYLKIISFTTTLDCDNISNAYAFLEFYCSRFFRRFSSSRCFGSLSVCSAIFNLSILLLFLTIFIAFLISAQSSCIRMKNPLFHYCFDLISTLPRLFYDSFWGLRFENIINLATFSYISLARLQRMILCKDYSHHSWLLLLNF